MNTIGRVIIGSLYLLIPEVAQANGGLPIIFLVNLYAFLAGIVLVVIIETNYLKQVFIDTPKKTIIICVLKFNAWSSLFGVILIPIFILLIQLDPIFFLTDHTTTKPQMTLVWWSSFGIDLLLAYIATVYIEYKPNHCINSGQIEFMRLD